MSVVLVIELYDVSFCYEGFEMIVFYDVSFEIDVGDFCGVFGLNGGGKSIFLCFVLGFVIFECGCVELFGKVFLISCLCVGYVL